MKQLFSSLLALLMLAGFLAGGAVAPTVHLVQHAQERHAAQEAHCAHDGHDTPSAERGETPSELEHCWTSTRHLMSVAPAPVQQAAALRQEAVRSAVVLALRASPIEDQNVIRGPPGRA